MDTEKQDAGGVSEEIITGARQGQGAKITQLKSERFDPESLLDRVDGDMELLRELVGVFAEEGPRMLAKIQEAINNGSAPELEKASHKMKGSVLQFSAHAAVADALELEEKGRNGSIAGAEPILARLRQEFELLQANLNFMVCDDAAR